MLHIFLLNLWFRGFYFERKDLHGLMISASTQIMGIWVGACLLQVTIYQFRLKLVLVKLWPDDSPSNLCDHMFGYISWNRRAVLILTNTLWCLSDEGMYDITSAICQNLCLLILSHCMTDFCNWSLNKQLVQNAVE